MKTLLVAVGTIAVLGSVAGWSSVLTVVSLAICFVSILVIDLSNDTGWSK